MKFKNIQTLEHLIIEYGLQPGKPTPVGQQQTGSIAKATSTSPTVKGQSPSPSTQVTPTEKEPVEPTTITKPIKDIPADTEIKDKSGKLVGTVVTSLGDKENNPDAVVVKNKFNKYDVVDADQKFDIEQDPEMESLINELEELSLGEQLAKLLTVDRNFINEAWSKKYKDSINCSNPKGFSQKAHCAGKKKTNERKKSLRNPKDNPCWDGYKPVGTKKKNGKTVPNCVPKESVAESTLTYLRDSVPDNSKIRILNDLLSKPFPATDIKGQMNAFFAIPDPNMINDFRRARAGHGDETCLRPILRNYVKKMHPMLIKQINLNESVKLKEYDDLAAEQAKIAEIIKTLDISDERDAKLVDQIWRILNSEHIQSVIGTVVAKPIADETAMNKEAATKVLTKVIYQVESDYKTIKAFLDDLEESGTAVNIEELTRPGVNSFANIFKSQMAFDVFKALMPYGAGKQKKGPGEFALAMLSNRIKLSEGGGDIMVDKDLVELKASSSETSSGGGRLGMNPLSQPQVLSILTKYQNDIPSIMQHMQSNASLGLGNAVQLLNNDIPVGDQRRYDIAYAVYSAFMSDRAAKFIANSFKVNSNASAVLKDFAMANYEDYRDKGGFTALLGLVLNAKKTVYITSAQEFADFFAGPHAGAPGVSFIPTKAGPTEMFLQLNIKKSGKI
jgi:hypothetical protein